MTTYQEANWSHASRQLQSFELERIRDYSEDTVWVSLIPHVSDVPFEWVTKWCDSLADKTSGESLGMQEMSSIIRLNDYINNAFIKPRFRSRNIFGHKDTTREMLTLISGQLQFVLADVQQFSARNQPYAFLFLLTKVEPDIVAAWDDEEMEKLVPYVIDGFPHEAIMIAYKNNLDLSISRSVLGVS